MKKLLMTLALLLTVLQGMWSAEPIAQAVWVEGTKTLHFIYQEAVAEGTTFDGKTATEVWSGTDVTATGTVSPGWRDIMNSVTKVEFGNSFHGVKPTSFYNWF